ncbi:MAG TPA: FkbM family methyltransferase [Phycisphaerales bacterium]|nr:FkbM family methyltransferase [Phycisphaerales bacterium]
MGLRTMLAKLLGDSQINQTDSGPAIATATAQAPNPDNNLDESSITEALFRMDQTPGVMIDVGAHFGGTTKPFLDMGWKVIGFEPDKKKHPTLKEIANDPNFTLLTCAVGDKPQKDVQFFTSQESTGIASLIPFRDTHTKGPTVEIRTLAEVIDELGLDRVDYLKVDAEGFDLRVLQGFPFDRFTPRCVMCEFEDGKTNQIGYTTDDLGRFLLDLGYTVFMSEWYPIVRYGITHRWRSIRQYPCQLTDTAGWGNFVAVLPGPDERKLRELLSDYF